MKNESEYSILILDDEPDIIESLSSLLALETMYKVLAFTSTSEAVAFIDNYEIDLAIVDFLMPGSMDGIEFLMALRKKQPYSIRIILTAYADKGNAIKAINEVGLYKYLEKPWNNDELMRLIHEGIEKRVLLRQLTDQFGDLSLL